MVSPEPGDYTSEVGAPTDIAPTAPTGAAAPNPAFQHSGGEDLSRIDWDRLAATPDFKGLLKRKAAFIIPASIFFMVYYFALPALVGYAKPLMETRVGPVNLAYLFALSQFFMAWIIAALYVRAANGFDRDSQAIAAQARRD